jgi:hypothetical protein
MREFLFLCGVALFLICLLAFTATWRGEFLIAMAVVIAYQMVVLRWR